MADAPLQSASANASTPAPIGEITPLPVTTTLALVVIAAEAERGVVAAERVRIIQNNFWIGVARVVWHDVKTAVGIWFLMVDGGRNPPGVERQRAGNGFDCARRTHRMSQHGFDRAHRDLRRTVTEQRSHRQRFNPVISRSARSVRAQIIDIIDTNAALFHGGT